VLTVGGIVQYDPPTLLLEGYYKPIPDLMLVLNLTTRFWEAYPGAQVPTTMLGRNAPPPEFRSLPSPRIAAEGSWHDRNFTLTLRGGYAFEPTPARPARMSERVGSDGAPIEGDLVATRVIDNHRHILSIGGGWIIHRDGGERFVLDVYGQLHVLQPRTHVIGRTSADGPPMVTSGYVLAGGWTLGLEF
jgi:hypothetical protein